VTIATRYRLGHKTLHLGLFTFMTEKLTAQTHPVACARVHIPLR